MPYNGVTMHVGLCRVSLRLPENDTLKGKRQVLRSITDRVRHRYNVAIAEVEDNDSRRSIVLGLSCVSNDGRHANEMLSKVVEYIDSIRGDAELVDYQIEVINTLT